jgi:hypothetical protein
MTTAKGKAVIGPVTIGEKNVKIVLIVSKSSFFKNASFFQEITEEVDFVLGDNQMSMSDYLTMEEMARREDINRNDWLMQQPSRLTATADSHGVVQKIEGQAELVQEPIGDGEESEQAGDENEQEDNDQDGGDDNDFDTDTDTDTDADEEEREQESGETGSNDDQDLLDSIANERDGIAEDIRDSTEETDYIPSTEEVDQYILSNEPKFDDIPYSAAELLRKRQETNGTWLEIADEYGVAKRVLESAVSETRKRVKKILKEKAA